MQPWAWFTQLHCSPLLASLGSTFKPQLKDTNFKLAIADLDPDVLGLLLANLKHPGFVHHPVDDSVQQHVAGQQVGQY